MAFTTRDTVYDEDEFSTPEAFITWVESKYDVTGDVIQREGPAGGWPVIGWSGSEHMLDVLDKDLYR